MKWDASSAPKEGVRNLARFNRLKVRRSRLFLRLQRARFPVKPDESYIVVSHAMVMVVGFRWLVLRGICFLSGCAHAGTELELTTLDRTQDQGQIAEFYSQEAARFRYMACDLADRVTVYEHVFG
jgi:hypothetical protein